MVFAASTLESQGQNSFLFRTADLRDLGAIAINELPTKGMNQLVTSLPVLSRTSFHLHLVVHTKVGVFEGRTSQAHMLERDALLAERTLIKQLATTSVLVLFTGGAEASSKVLIPGSLLAEAVFIIRVQPN